MSLALREFQDRSVSNALELLEATYEQLSKTKDPASRKLIIKHNGCLLIEAPTGAGKTLIAGHTAERFSVGKKIVWFWFAPFAGLIEQSIKTINAEFQGLSVKDPKKDRNIEGIKSGDIFVTVWAAVAANSAENRKTRTTGDDVLSLDILVPALKGLGFQIGVIVDEAHHGFKTATEALSFYNNVLSPEYTVMVTATPKDKDIEIFKTSTGFAEVHKIAISRTDCIEAGLIKKGVKSIAFFVEDDAKSITDFEKTALRSGLQKHYEITKALENEGIDLKPLMLVQVDSKSDINTVEEAKRKLIELGVPEGQIATHTATEPDPNLLALANDESVQFLIFKVAVALGFDCPRAFTLVSMRRSRDVDFGVQVVGRILRVHKLLQFKEISDVLQYGYVVLADYSIQDGLTKAADRISSISNQLTTASTNIGLVVITGEDIKAQEMKGGQSTFWDEFIEPEQTEQKETKKETDNRSVYKPPVQTTFFKDEPLPEPTVVPIKKIQTGYKEYKLKEGFPTIFRKEICNADMVSNIAKCIADQLKLDGDILSVGFREFTRATKRETDIFNTEDLVDIETTADISFKEIAKMAQGILFDDDNISGRTLHDLLIKRLQSELNHRGLVPKNSIEDALCMILTANPRLIKDAKRKCYANFIETIETAPIPDKIISDEPLQPSKLNIYGVVPAGLTTDEQAFVTMIDNDTSGTILWWHRNIDRKPYSVSLVMPELKHDYYPDFIVGVKDRNTENNVILVEIKGEMLINGSSTVAKARAVHKVYRKVMMLHWRDKKNWMTIVNSKNGEQNEFDQNFRKELLETY